MSSQSVFLFDNFSQFECPNDAEGIDQRSLVHLRVFVCLFVIIAHWTYSLLFLTVNTLVV
jgi:hypothetical protein